jgi:hypothetical protein
VALTLGFGLGFGLEAIVVDAVGADQAPLTNAYGR